MTLPTLLEETPRPDLSGHFLVRSFFDVNRQTFGGRLKTILGGPPFVRYAELKKSQPELVDLLRERFSSIKTGQFDLYMPFIEHAVDLLDDGNRIGFSLSNSFLHTGTGKGICRFITDRCSPLEVLEFSGGSIYPDAAVQIALLRLVVGKKESNQGRYVLLEPATDIRNSLEQLYASESLPPEIGKEIPLEENELIPEIIPMTPAIRCDGIRFGDLPVEFFYGATSKSDEIFMVKDYGTGSQGVRHGLPRNTKKTVQFERELTVPIIRGREIKGFRYAPVAYFYLVPYVDGALIDRQTLENDFPITFRYLERFQAPSREKEDWYAYYTPPAYRRDEVIVSCRIASPRSFARMDLSEKTIHGSAFGIATKGGGMNISLLLLYLNSGDFWKQIDATMPPMGVGRRSIRMSTLKGLLIPRQIAFPSEYDVSEAKALERRIVQAVGRKKPEVIQSIFAELDSFIEGIVM